MANENSPIPTHKPSDEPMFVTWTDGDTGSLNTALSHMGQGRDINEQHQHVIANRSSTRSLRTLSNDLTIRGDFRRNDLEATRPGMRVPKKPKEIIATCMQAYERVGLIKNIIDLMADFACQGIEITHPNPAIEKFYKAWFNKVSGKDRSERFLNLLYRSGNVIVRRQTAKLPKSAEKQLKQSAAAPDLKIEKERIPSREVPIRYIFMNPISLDVLGDDLAPFVGDINYAVKLSTKVRAQIKDQAKELQGLLNRIPPEIMKALNTDKAVPLDPEKTVAYYYKKDDWDAWARPLIYAILDDIILLEHMRLADLAALDGVISNVRIWKLGSLEHKIMPTPAAIAKLGAILEGGVGQSIDLIWGPELEYEQHFPEVSKILGSEKYVSVMEALFQGLGVPPTLTGTATSGGFTNNFISLRTLLERLEYGRDKLSDFWSKEFVRVQKAMGFKKPATVKFNHMTLTDDIAEKALWIQLADRNIISIETLLNRFGESSELELIRMLREEKLRSKDRLPPRTGPYEDPQLDDKQEGEIEKIKKSSELAPKPVGGNPSKPKDRAGKGRPKNSKDSSKRKTKKTTIRTSASEEDAVLMYLWTKNTFDGIDGIINPAYLAFVNATNLRRLTNEQSAILDELKFSIMCNIEPYSNISEDDVLKSLKSPLPIPDGVKSIYSDCLKSAKMSMPNVTANDIRQIRTLAYSIYHTNGGENDG